MLRDNGFSFLRIKSLVHSPEELALGEVGGIVVRKVFAEVPVFPADLVVLFLQRNFGIRTQRLSRDLSNKDMLL